MKQLSTLSMVFGLWLVLILGCSAPNSPSNQSQSSPPAQTPSPQNTLSKQIGWKPQEACGYLSHISGLQAGSYKNEYENVYGCLSPYKNIGEDFPLANNIAYYVNGDGQNATELKLVLNVNARQSAKEAHAALLNYSDELTKKALEVPLTKDVRNALTSGKVGHWTVGKAKVEVKRDDWPTGKGYEVHYILRKSA